MTLATQMVTDLTAIFSTNEFAQSVTYAGTGITAVVIPRDGQEMDGERTAKVADLYVKSSDVATPAYRDAVVIGSTTYRVIEVPAEAQGGAWKLMIQQDERPVI